MPLRLPPLRSTSLVFAPGEVELSLLLSVHEDGEPESNEFFDLFLYDPWGGARLGAQQRTRVTVVDAQSNSSTSDHTLTAFYLGEGEGEAGDTHSIVAGTVDNVTLVSKDVLGRERGFGGDVFAVWVEAKELEALEVREAAWSFRPRRTPRTQAVCTTFVAPLCLAVLPSLFPSFQLVRPRHSPYLSVWSGTTNTQRPSEI